MKCCGLVVLVFGLLLGILLAPFASAQESNETARLLSELIRVNTSNPPGQEGKLAALLAEKFRPLGFEVTILPTPNPDKAHLAVLTSSEEGQPCLNR